MLQGTGWLLEKYDGSECSTLVSYLAHVRQEPLQTCTCVVDPCFSLQLDLKELPPVIVNRVLRRQPLAIHYIRRCITIPSSVPATLASSFAISDNTVSSASVDLDVPYEDSNPVNYFTNRYSDRNRHYTRTPSSPVYPWVKQANTDSAELRPKSATFSVSSRSSTGYSIQPLHDDNVPPPESSSKECVEEVSVNGVTESGVVQDSSPEPTLEVNSSQLTPRCRAFSLSLPDFDIPDSNDFPGRDGAQPPSSPAMKPSPSQIQGRKHLARFLRAGLLSNSGTRVMSCSCLSSSL